MSDIDLTIVIPTRDRLELLQRAYRSALEQVQASVEVIISDNSVGQETFNYFSELCIENLKYYRQNGMLSMYDNWNCGVSMASGKYLVILSDDDYLEPDFSSFVISEFNNKEYGNDLGAVITGCRIINSIGVEIGSSLPPSKVWNSIDLVNFHLKGGFACYPCAMVYRTEDLLKIGMFDSEKFGLPADIGVWISVAKIRLKMLTCEGVKSNYCLHGFNATADAKLNGVLSGLSAIKADLLEFGRLSKDKKITSAVLDRYIARVCLSLCSVSSRGSMSPAAMYLKSLMSLRLRWTLLLLYPDLVLRYLFSSIAPDLYVSIKRKFNDIRGRHRGCS